MQVRLHVARSGYFNGLDGGAVWNGRLQSRVVAVARLRWVRLGRMLALRLCRVCWFYCAAFDMRLCSPFVLISSIRCYATTQDDRTPKGVSKGSGRPDTKGVSKDSE